MAVGAQAVRDDTPGRRRYTDDQCVHEHDENDGAAAARLVSTFMPRVPAVRPATPPRTQRTSCPEQSGTPTPWRPQARCQPPPRLGRTRRAVPRRTSARSSGTPASSIRTRKQATRSSARTRHQQSRRRTVRPHLPQHVLRGDPHRNLTVAEADVVGEPPTATPAASPSTQPAQRHASSRASARRADQRRTARQRHPG